MENQIIEYLELLLESKKMQLEFHPNKNYFLPGCLWLKMSMIL